MAPPLDAPENLPSVISATDSPSPLPMMRLVGESISIRIGNKDDAENKGGFNLFGRSFGDYAQDIILTLVYPRS